MDKEHVSPSTAVIEAVADASNTQPCDLPEQLHEAIEPDALDQLFTDSTTDGRVYFEYCDYSVTVESDGAVAVEPIVNSN